MLQVLTCMLVRRNDTEQSFGQKWGLLSHERQVRAHSQIQESCAKSNLCSVKVEFGLFSRVQAGKTGPSLEMGLSHQPHSLLHSLLLAEICWSVMELDWGTQDTQRKREKCLWTLDDSEFAGSWTEVFWTSILNLGSFILPCSHSGHLHPHEADLSTILAQGISGTCLPHRYAAGSNTASELGHFSHRTL